MPLQDIQGSFRDLVLYERYFRSQAVCPVTVLLQACMDCYFRDCDKDPQDTCCKLLPKSELIAALDFFNIPTDLRPPGVRMAMKTLEQCEDHKKHLRDLMRQCVQVRCYERLLQEST